MKTKIIFIILFIACAVGLNPEKVFGTSGTVGSSICNQADASTAVQNLLDKLANGDTLTVECVAKIGASGIHVHDKTNISILGSNNGGFRATSRTNQTGQIDAKGPTLLKIWNCNSCSIQDLIIDGNNIGESGLHIENSRNTVLKNLNISNISLPGSCALCTSGNHNNQYVNNTIHDTNQANGDAVRGMWIGNASETNLEWNPTVTGNHTYSTGHTGIVVHGIAAIIRNNKAENTKPGIGSAGIKIVPAPRTGHPGTTYVENNTLQNNNGQGLQIESSNTDGVVVQNNTMSGNLDSGVLINGRQNENIIIKQNIITNNSTGVNVTNGKSITITQNQISGDGNAVGVGLVVNTGSSVSGVTITSNQFSGMYAGVAIYNYVGSRATVSNVSFASNSFSNENKGIYIEDKSGGGYITGITLGSGNCFNGNNVSVDDYRGLLSSVSQLLSCINPIIITVPPIIPPVIIVGDLNDDNIVNSVDLSLLTSKWNQNFSAYDLNSDDIVNSLDYVLMVQNWSP